MNSQYFSILESVLEHGKPYIPALAELDTLRELENHGLVKMHGYSGIRPRYVITDMGRMRLHAAHQKLFCSEPGATLEREDTPATGGANNSSSCASVNPVGDAGPPAEGATVVETWAGQSGPEGALSSAPTVSNEMPAPDTILTIRVDQARRFHVFDQSGHPQTFNGDHFLAWATLRLLKL